MAEQESIGRKFFEAQDRLRGGPDPALCTVDYTADVNGNHLDLAAHQGMASMFYAAFPDLQHIIEDVRRKKSAGFIGACFHQTLAAMTLELCTRLCNRYDINEVVLSGGVWQNQLLLDLVRSALIQNEFIVYTHRQTPANDGGLALGQAAVAAFK